MWNLFTYVLSFIGKYMHGTDIENAKNDVLGYHVFGLGLPSEIFGYRSSYE